MRYLLPVVVSMLMLGFACGGDGDADDEPAKADEAKADDAKADDAKADDAKADDAKADDADDDDDDRSSQGPRGRAGRGGKAGGKAGGRARGLSYDEAAVTCCGNDRIDKALKEYLDVQQNLFKDAPSTGDANALWGHLDTAAGDASLPRASRDAARRAADEAAAVKDEDNATIRAHFDAISVEMYNLVANHKGSGEHHVAYVFCPAGGGAHWLQSASSVQNPYQLSGAASGCGQFQR